MSEDRKRMLDELRRAVLESTVGGDACRQAADRLVDAPSDETARELLESHVAGCTDCAELARVLTHLEQDLPAIAFVDPGADFTERVLRGTLGSRSPAGLADRVRDRFLHWARRPRFALELSYVSALVIWVLFGISGTSPLDQLSQWVQRAPVRVVEGAGRFTVDTAQLVGVSADRFVREGGERSFDYAGELGTQLIRLPEQIVQSTTRTEAEDATKETDDGTSD